MEDFYTPANKPEAERGPSQAESLVDEISYAINRLEKKLQPILVDAMPQELTKNPPSSSLLNRLNKTLTEVNELEKRIAL